MKESRAFTHFFKLNLALLVVFIVGGGSIGVLVQASRPTIYSVDHLFEVRSTSVQVPEKTLVESLTIADHLVGLLRTRNVQQQIDLPFGSDINSVRFSTVGFRLSASSSSLSESTKTLTKASEYMLTRFNQDYPGSNYSLASVGSIQSSTSRPSVAIGVFIGVFLGFVAGLISALIKTYLKHF